MAFWKLFILLCIGNLLFKVRGQCEYPRLRYAEVDSPACFVQTKKRTYPYPGTGNFPLQAAGA